MTVDAYSASHNHEGKLADFCEVLSPETGLKFPADTASRCVPVEKLVWRQGRLPAGTWRLVPVS